MKYILLIPHLQIHNANALSSPYTIGFPAMTAWLGACHALQRKLQQHGFSKISLNSIAVCSHELQLQTHKGPGDYEYSIIGTGNPLDKSGARSAFIEEARCHLEVSLVIEYTGLEAGEDDTFIETVSDLLHSRLKMASGDIMGFKPPLLMTVGDEQDLRKLTRKLMPGYLILERRELMQTAMEQGQDPLNAMLDYIKVMHRSEQDEQGHASWKSHRKTTGWIVPIATGFHGISPLEKASHQRDSETPHRFAESIVTLGEFVMPYRIKDLDTMLWHYHTDPQNNLYLCQQNTFKENNNG